MEITEFYFPSDYVKALWDNKEQLFRGGICLNGYFFHYKMINEELVFLDEKGQDALHIIRDVGKDKVKLHMQSELQFIQFLESILINQVELELNLNDMRFFEFVDTCKQKTLRIENAKLKTKEHITFELSFRQGKLGEVIIIDEETGVFCSNFDEALSEEQKNVLSTNALTYIDTQK